MTTSYTPFDIYTTVLPDRVFQAFTRALGSAPRQWESDIIDVIEASIYDAISGTNTHTSTPALDARDAAWHTEVTA